MGNFIKIYPVGSSEPYDDLPEPAYKGIQWSIQDVDYDAGRMMDGTMRRNRVAVKRKLTVTWPPMVPSDVQRVLRAVRDEQFDVETFDFESGSARFFRMYVGDRTVPYLSDKLGEVLRIDDDGNPVYSGLCDSFTISFVEF